MSRLKPHRQNLLNGKPRQQPIEAPPVGQGVGLGTGQGILILLATPIGHAQDVTLRGLDALREADLIACEDTRTTRQLMQIHGLTPKGKLIAYHDHNADKQRPIILSALAHGKNVVVASDAGTPLISDPGYKLVQATIAAGHVVTAIPGPSASLTALILSGLPTDRFLFAGFLPPKSAARKKFLASLKMIEATLIFYESPHRVAESLRDMQEILGDRQACLARELTKKFEDIRRGTLSDLGAGVMSDPPRGEIVLVVSGVSADDAQAQSDEDWHDVLKTTLATTSLRDAVDRVSAQFGLKRREVYRVALTMTPGDNES